ncbi:hypothetical protein SOPP22_10790 [Shewanella sp. OPT22]|nr:hypothetical protein SOPP22_10790 [Shewanella sp. OPT22]
MKGKYSKIILDFCEKNEIYVPVGFKRHSASHLAVIKFDGENRKLVAKTFFKSEDLKYYVSNSLLADSEGDIVVTVIDFKELNEYKVTSSGQLQMVSKLTE